jgi:hypothetical protein
MRPLIGLLLAPLLAAQGAGGSDLPLDLRTDLGSDLVAQIRLAPSGCWNGLLLGASTPPARPKPRRPAEATVEIWDLALRESPRHEAFGLYLGALRKRLSKALELPPPSHQSIELSEFMLSDPANPQKLDLTRVESMQERFNKLPPNGSPVK